jgi:hypothetical protein
MNKCPNGFYRRQTTIVHGYTCTKWLYMQQLIGGLVVGRTYYEYGYSQMDQRQKDRSEYRNMSSNCTYCAYRYKPSASMGGTCTVCPSKLIVKKTEQTV